MKVGVHKLMMVVLMLKDLKKKKVVGLVCPIDKISDELSLTNAKKGFKFKGLKDLKLHKMFVIVGTSFLRFLKLRRTN